MKKAPYSVRYSFQPESCHTLNFDTLEEAKAARAKVQPAGDFPSAIWRSTKQTRDSFPDLEEVPEDGQL